MEEHLDTIGGLSNAFFAVYWVDLRANTCKALKNIPYFEEAVQNCLTTDDVTDAFIRLRVQPEDQEKMRAFTDRQHLSELLENNNLIVEEFHGTIDPWEWCRASWIVASRATSPTAGRARCGHCRRICAQYTPQFAGDRLRPSADAGGRGKRPPLSPISPLFQIAS